jgi:hypothetical protein
MNSSASMKRTTVFLPEPLHENLRQEAFRTRVSMAEIIRSRLELATRPSGKPRRDLLAKAEGAVRHGTLSQDIDEALYGD